VSFLLQVLAFIVLIAGLGWLATSLGVSQDHVLIGAAALICAGAFTAISRTLARDPA
jgi:hypothetical protein